MKNMRKRKKNPRAYTPFLRTGALILLAALIFMLSGVQGVQAWFTDNLDILRSMTAGKVKVQLVEYGDFEGDEYIKAPVVGDDRIAATDPEAVGIEADTKIFSGKLLEGGPAYVRAHVKMSVELFFEDKGEWRTLAVPQDSVVLAIASGAKGTKANGEEFDDNSKWIITDKNSVKTGEVKPVPVDSVSGKEDFAKADEFDPSCYLYFNEIMNENDVTDQLMLKLKKLDIPEKYRNLNARYRIYVTVEAAQVANGQWKEIFQITDLPFETE